ncbi:Cobyrinic acid ac-diamide synthase [Conexibacter woesei DSM 14684]|uniref:Cobyrinic acid ac-diamide synthase n=1 Tax=Conexibacter woesei (strain DSM 14684 / CCUG 47730 / CIP 108061 / JCM 11494 / NBRC 100937 / ID131577) TaxID=469383 RepID=D3F473_CONWI|nr:Cobyrinic acid ac-diamide synthase [Conexibacter woesei DSM 14684]
MAASVAFFNNKGGVGKTTLACNYAAYEASQGNEVLIVDLDPQCNSTQLVLDDDQWDEIYEDRRTSEPKTVMGLLRHFRGGEARLDMGAWNPIKGERFDVDVLPGHPSLSILEDLLSEAWSGLKAGGAAGARRSLWLRALREEIERKYDLIVIDASPSLGAINRSALVGSDTFVTPMAPDLFSLYALENITGWFERWIKEYDGGRVGAQEELEAIGYELKIPDPLPIQHGFVGYTVQQYVSRSSGGEVRQTEAYEQHRREIPKRARSLSRLSRLDGSPDLGTVPNMFSMIPLAQSCHSPIAGLQKEDGLRGAQISQQQRYVDQLQEVFGNIATRVAEAVAD